MHKLIQRLIQIAIALTITLLFGFVPPAIARTSVNPLTSVSSINPFYTQETIMTAQQMTAQQMTAPQSAIMQVLNTYAEGWVQGDAAILKSIWDFTDEQSTYLPAEYAEVIKGPNNIIDYYDQNAGGFVTASIDLKNPVIDVLGEDYAQAYCAPEWIVIDDDGADSPIYPRLSFTLKRSGDQWSVIHYHESLQYTES